MSAWQQASSAPVTAPSHQATTVADTPFPQQYHTRHVLTGGPAANDVRAVAVDGDGNVWAAARAGVFRLGQDRQRWSSLLPRAAAGPAYALAVEGEGTVWVGAWNGLYRSGPQGLEKIAGIAAPISAIGIDQKSVVALGPKGCWRVGAGLAAEEPIPCTQAIRAALPDGEGGLWIATQMGLYHQTGNGSASGYWKREQLVSADVRDIAYAADGALWVGSLGGIGVFDRTGRVCQFTGSEGLASVDLRCVERGPDGRMWVGSSLGVSVYDGNSWSLRHSRRWLVGDQVCDIAFDQEATAWIATNAGVSAIKQKSITLAEKAAHYDRICETRHVRPPGLVEKCRLATPGDTSTWEPVDDDNDGQYTSMYLAMESFRYATTKDPRAKANARRAFDALQFLQTVTGTSGFVARTVVPSDWTRVHDPNRHFSDPEWADRLVEDPRNKRVDVRWRRSADGQWLWKGDTSSDEITGHYYGYLYYYDLVADEAERERVRNHVRKVTNAIVDNGYVLRGMDGTPTRWGVWAPAKLNHDPNWAMDRNVNSVEILSYLKAAFHMTGDEKYQQGYLDLIRNHGYAENARRAKSMGPAWRTHIDDELLALAFPALLKYETDPALRAIYRQSLDHWYRATREDRSPFANFTYSGLSGQCLDLETSIGFLRDAPLDLVRWRVDNSKRIDLRLTNLPEMEMVQTSRLLPPSEIGFFRWDRNPWQAVQGDGGHTESDGVFWLLPYWMGRHQGLIQAEIKPGSNHPTQTQARTFP